MNLPIKNYANIYEFLLNSQSTIFYKSFTAIRKIDDGKNEKEVLANGVILTSINNDEKSINSFEDIDVENYYFNTGKISRETLDKINKERKMLINGIITNTISINGL